MYTPEKPYNRPLPRSQTSSGSETDEICGAITQSEAGLLGLDKAIKLVDADLKSRNEVLSEAGTNTPPPMLTAEGNSEAVKLGKGLSSWKDTKLQNASGNPLHSEMDPIFRR